MEQNSIQGLENDQINEVPEGLDLNRNPDLEGGKDKNITITPVEHKTRYSVGEVIYGVCFDIDGDDFGGYALPYLFNLKPVTAIHIVKLTVTEHHRVRDSWAKKDAKPDCDGFILKDDAGNVWHNQYPMASYGQTSDEGNRRFHRHIAEEGGLKKLIDNKELFEVHLLTDVIGSISRGIKHFGLPETMESMADQNRGEELKERLALLNNLKECIDYKLLQYGQIAVEVPVWSEYPDITTFKLQQAQPSTILSTKHMVEPQLMCSKK